MLKTLGILFLVLWGRSAYAQTATFTPNPSLTPPCLNPGTFGNTGTGNAGGTIGSAPMMRGSVYTLSAAVTIYSLTVYCAAPPTNSELITGIYSGSSGNFGTLLVSSSAQTVVSGWNGFPITPTYLTAGTYWLAFMWNDANYDEDYTSSSTSNIEAFTSSSTGLSFGTMPTTMPTPSYGTGKELIYALYCLPPTNTPTVTYTPTITPTPTITYTPTNTYTASNTGTIDTNTPTPTQTWTPTFTCTSTITPNTSLTPSCGGSFTSFGDSATGGSTGYVAGAQLRAGLYNLPSAGTVQTMSLYCTSYSSGSTGEVALYSNNSNDTMGTLLAQSVTQTLTSGWNNFVVPSAGLTAGNYWLAYIFSAPVSYSLVYQTSPAAVTTLAYTSTVSSWTFYSSGSSYPLSYAGNWYEPILANVCANVTPNTATFTPTWTNTQTPTGTQTTTNTWTATGTMTNSFTPTPTLSVSSTASPTWTNTTGNTATFTPTNTWSGTETSTLTWTQTLTQTPTGTDTVGSTSTNTGTVTSTLTATVTPTWTLTNTVTLTPDSSYTDTPTPTWTGTETVTPTFSATLTQTSTPTISWTATWTNTGTVSMTFTAANTSSATASFTATASGTLPFTATPTCTATTSLTATNTAPPGNTATATWTGTSTMTANGTSSSTGTFTATPGPTDTLGLYPNPLQGSGNPTLQIYFSQPHDYVSVKVFTTAFRKVYDDRVDYVPAGTFTYSIASARFKGGESIANGLYYVLVTTPSDRWLKKLLILR